MGISTQVFNKFHLYEPAALDGFWAIQVKSYYVKRGEERERKEREKKGGGKERKRRGKV